MDFLRRHVEKLILGLALLALLASIALVLRSLTNTRTEVNKTVEESRQAANGGRPIELLDPDSFGEVYKELSDPKVRFDTLPTEATAARRGSLYEPADFILCYSEACSKLIPYDADKCPFCATAQPDKSGKGVADRDADGIPNSIEQKYAFLNPDNPQDARLDQDQDGFLNVEEFRAGTDMQDPKSTPPLGTALRLVLSPAAFRIYRILARREQQP